MRDALDLLRRTQMPSAAALEEDGLLRNVMVHEYVRVDLEQVAAALPGSVAGYERYVDAVADFLLTR